MMARPRITAIRPIRALEGGRVSVVGEGLPVESLPRVSLDDQPARVVFASSSRTTFIVPPGLDGGATAVRVEDVPGETHSLADGTASATGAHQDDNTATLPAAHRV